MKIAAVVFYLVFGCWLSADFAVWQRKHCPEPPATVSDVIAVAIGWPLLAAIAFIAWAIEDNRQSVCH